MGANAVRSARQAVVFVAIGLALGAQQLTVRPPQATLGWVVYAVAGVLFVVAAWSREPRVTLAMISRCSPPSTPNSTSSR
jgi:hypothetical protein